ncbi:MAG: N-acetylmuramoyl-L-alanine amidase [Candidatus Sericytochromatia bacterium]|nr:N-acetylmuramoyl-L-alanine amidase [Candidatus Sericytochromatia bacterium]
MGRIRAQTIKFIVIHHSAANDAYSGAAALKAERQHRGEGYNFIVDDDQGPGNDGKYTAVQDAPDNEISNGVYGVNSQAWNICIDGNFEHQQPTADELHALVQVIATKARAWGWRKRDISRIVTHQYAGQYLSAERYGTACPGRNVISRMAEIRQRVAAYLPG